MNDFKREEEEQEEEDRIGDVVSSDSDDDQGGTNAMSTPVDAMLVPVYTMPLLVPTEVLHGIQAQDRLVIDLAADDTPYDSWARISEAQ